MTLSEYSHSLGRTEPLAHAWGERLLAVRADVQNDAKRKFAGKRLMSPEGLLTHISDCALVKAVTYAYAITIYGDMPHLDCGATPPGYRWTAMET